MMILKDKLDSFMNERGLVKDGEEEPPSEEDRNEIIVK